MIPQATTQLEPAAETAGRRKSILIVEDDGPQVLALTKRLENQGYATLSADEGRQGLSLATQQQPDLVILDLRLPDIDGLQVCERLADAPETCDIPVIIVSGMDQSDIIRRSRAAGCRYFLRKPYDPNALLTLIEHSLEHAADDEW